MCSLLRRWNCGDWTPLTGVCVYVGDTRTTIGHMDRDYPPQRSSVASLMASVARQLRSKVTVSTRVHLVSAVVNCRSLYLNKQPLVVPSVCLAAISLPVIFKISGKNPSLVLQNQCVTFRNTFIKNRCKA